MNKSIYAVSTGDRKYSKVLDVREEDYIPGRATYTIFVLENGQEVIYEPWRSGRAYFETKEEAEEWATRPVEPNGWGDL